MDAVEFTNEMSAGMYTGFEEDRVPDSEAFSFSDGTKVTTLNNLVHKIQLVDHDKFAHHVNDYKNDFAKWILHTWRMPVLASLVELARSQDEIVKVLSDHLVRHSHSLHQNQSFTRELQDDYYTPNKRENAQYQMVSSRSNIAPSVQQTVESASHPDSRAAIRSHLHHKAHAHKHSHAHHSTTSEPQVAQAVQEVAAETQQTTASNGPASPEPSVPPVTQSPQAEAQSPPSQMAPPVEQTPVPQEQKTPSSTAGIPETDPNNSTGSMDYYQDDEITSEEEVKRLSPKIYAMKEEIGKVFIGQEDVVEGVLMCMMCDAHALLEGVPGLAKSLFVEVLSQVVDGTDFKRIQFLPDMLPADVIGGQIYNPKKAAFEVYKGPIFANFVLADEINRAPPKTHAALMECMQEKKVNIENDQFVLDRPFLVLATQNPLENKGTFELPEAVVDRFMFKLVLDYPKREDEMKIITNNATTKKVSHLVEAVVTKEEFMLIQKKVKRIYISEKIREYILDIIEATRGLNKRIEGFQFVKWGGGPRASIYLGIAARARAFMMNRNYVLPEDISYVAPNILRHRMILNYKGKAHNISQEKVVEEILMKVQKI